MFLNFWVLKCDKKTNKLHFWSLAAPFLNNLTWELTITIIMSVYDFSVSYLVFDVLFLKMFFYGYNFKFKRMMREA